jgi:hypothetical protein
VLTFLLAVLAAGTIASWRTGGALLAFFLAWLIATAPSALGIIEYNYSAYASDNYIYIILATLGSFATGYGFSSHNSSRAGVRSDHILQADSFHFWEKAVPYLVAVGALSMAMMVWNVFIQGLDVSNLTDLRLDVIAQEAATLPAKIASVTTWACFTCLALAIYFRARLSTLALLMLLGVGSGALLSSFLSAGRQAIFQSIILLFLMHRARLRHDTLFGLVQLRSRVSITGGLFIAGALSLIMFITVNRFSSDYGLDRSGILMRLFDARIDPAIDNYLASLGPRVYDVVVESLLYISHSVPLFSLFSDIQFPGNTYGQMSFPFFFRQLEPITGLSVTNALQTKIEYLNAAGLLGVGWNTALSQTMMDFGVFGSCMFFFGQGYVSGLWDRRTARYATFGASLLSGVLFIAALYTPYLLLFSDTAMLSLFVFGALLFYIAMRQPGAPMRTPSALAV